MSLFGIYAKSITPEISENNNNKNMLIILKIEPVRFEKFEKTNNLGSGQVRHKSSCTSHRRWLEAGNLGFRK